jgi:ABC-type lipoprotein release transport system permease subunit
VIAALAGGRVLESLVYGVRPGDWATVLAAAIGLVLTALATILIATRGAARTDPVVALRAE